MTTQPATYQQRRWTLETLFTSPDDSAVEQSLTDLTTLAAEIEAVRPALSPDISSELFVELFNKIERFAELARRLASYGHLWFAEDTQNQQALGFIGRIDQALTDLDNRILFVSLWWKSLDDETANRLLAHAGDLRYSLEQERLFKDHTLSEPEEKIINIKNVNGANALTTLYDMITNKFVFELEVDGKKKELTRSELMTYVRHPSPDLRQAAYQELYRVFGQEESVLAQIYVHRVRDWASENLQLRSHASPIAVRNLGNDIPDSVVDTLLNVCAEQASVFHRYFNLKGQWLGLSKLRRYDLYAPLSSGSTKNIDFEQAAWMVLDSLDQFSPQVSQLAQRVFDDNHIDSELRPNKRSGAFCASVLPQMTPFVMCNYTGEPREVATLAHELGHAIHSMLAADHSILTFHSALPLSETASVFSEMLLTDRLLAEETDPTLRRDVLAEAVDDAYATVLRQAYFVIFEREAHKVVANGGTMDDLHKIYLENLHRQFGDSLDLSDDFEREWLVIPHIYHTPFYCYAYSFGQLLSLSLYRQYKQEGESFKPRLIKILSYGGSASPVHILEEASINIADPDFWRGGFQVIAGMIDELERIG